MFELAAKAVLQLVENDDTGGNDLCSDAVTRDCCDPIGFHRSSLPNGGGDMRGAIRAISVAVTLSVQASYAADIDRTAVQFTVPADIKWVRNAAGTNEQAILFGD